MNATVVARKGKKPTGLGNYSRNLIRELLRLDENIKVVLIPGKEIKLHKRGLGGMMYINLKLLSTKFKSDVVHSLNLQPLNPKINIITLHDLTPFKRKRMDRFLFKYIHLGRLKYMRRIITPTNHVAEVASNVTGLDRDRFTTIYYGLDHETFTPSNKIPPEIEEDKYNLLYVGEVRRRKNIHLIIKAVSLLGEEYRLIKIGPDIDGYYKDECLKLVGEGGVDFVDINYLPGSEIRHYYSNVDLLIYPSREEGFGLPPLEAMACGTTSVVSDIPVFREVYQNNVFYSEMNPEDLADKIEYAVKHRKDKLELMDYTKRFTWERAARETKKIYEESL